MRTSLKNCFNFAVSCEWVYYPTCQRYSNYTRFPNIFGNHNHTTAVNTIQYLQSVYVCSEEALHLACSSVFLQCDTVTGMVRMPCRSFCYGKVIKQNDLVFCQKNLFLIIKSLLYVESYHMLSIEYAVYFLGTDFLNN